MSLYAYCLSEEVSAEAVEPLTGVEGAKPYLVQLGDIWAVVSEFGARQVGVTRENVTAHERVVRRVLVETTPLPFRFGSVVDEAQLLAYVDSQRGALKAQLDHVRGCVEMSVKIIWDPEAVRGKAQAADAVKAVQGSGTAFLEAKRREVLGDEVLGRRAREVAGVLAGCLGDAVRDFRVDLRPAEALMLAAGHLVERNRLAEYRTRVNRARKELGELRFLTSGPWPPYSFTSAGS